MRKSGITSGTTAVLAFLGPEDIIVANCGDSRSVLRCAIRASLWLFLMHDSYGCLTLGSGSTAAGVSM